VGNWIASSFLYIDYIDYISQKRLKKNKIITAENSIFKAPG